jgi:hypothetical protein
MDALLLRVPYYSINCAKYLLQLTHVLWQNL